MSRLKILSAFLSLTLILVSVRPTIAQTPQNEMEAFFDAYLAEQMQIHHIPGVVVSVVKDGDVLFAKGYGYANIEKQIPFNENTLLTVASLGKTFTAVGVLQLNEVAESLHISKATVKSHLIQICNKLGVSDRTAAVTTAIERGIIRL